MTIKLVKQIKKSAKNAFDDEIVALCDSWLKLRRLKKYATHEYDCNVMSLVPRPGQGCSCGFD